MKSKRVTNASGNVVSTVELDPWGGETNRSSNEAFQPKKFTTYERDVNGSDEATHRRYNRWWSRFEQPDPYDGSYSLTDPQSFNRYAYTQNDPVNFVDPTGLFNVPNCEVIDGQFVCYGPDNTFTTDTNDRGSRSLPGGAVTDWGGFEPLPLIQNVRTLLSRAEVAQLRTDTLKIS